MKLKMLGAVGAVWLLGITGARAQTTNSWTGSASVFWEATANWSAARIPTNTDTIFITNVFVRPATIRSNTTNTTSMVISNLTMSEPAGATNTLALTTAGTNVPFRILNNCTITAGGALVISNGAVQVDNVNGQVLPFRDDGQVWLTSPTARLVNTNAFLVVGVVAEGMMTVSNGAVLANRVQVARGTGSRGTLTIAGGTNNFASDLRVGAGGSSTGVVWVTGGNLIVTNGPINVGDLGVGQMTLSNGTVLATNMTVAGNVGGSGTLTIAGGTLAAIGPFEVVANVVGLTGTVWVTGGQLVVTNTPDSVDAGSGFIVDGSVRLGFGSSGSIIVSNVNTIIGNAGSGSLTVSGGSTLFNDLIVGNLAGSIGTITFADGTNRTLASTAIGLGTGSAGTVWITGGLFNPANGFIFVVGSGGSGQLNLSNGTFRSGLVEVGGTGGSVGTLTVAGGTWDGPGALGVGEAINATGTVWIKGGTVDLTGFSFFNTIGTGGGVGRMAVSNGLVSASVMNLGVGAGVGTLTMAGGTNTVYSGMFLGSSTCTATGTVVIAGGRLNVTNSAGTAVLEVRSGTVQLNSGTLAVDQFVMTNACANFIRTGRTLVYGSAVLSSNRDDDDDGMNNAFEQANGLDPLNPADASIDSDGDGFTNLQEFQSGTDPNDSASFLHIVSFATEGLDRRVVWTTRGGTTNVLQILLGNVFVDNSPSIIIPGAGPSTTNYLDVGADTNQVRIYRVHLVP